MPKKRKGLAQVSIQIPEELLVAAHAKRGTRSLNAYLCELISRDTGKAFSPKPRGRPKKDPAKPRKSPGKGKKS